jgi:hypothetical protein
MLSHPRVMLPISAALNMVVWLLAQKLEVDLSTPAKICADTLTLIGSVPYLRMG